MELAQEVAPDRRSKFARKDYRPSQLLALLLLKRYNRWSYRDTEDRAQANPRLLHQLGLVKAPDHSTLARYHQRVRRPLLERLFGRVLERLKPELAGRRRALGDSSAYRLTQAGPHYLGSRWHKCKNENSPRRKAKRRPFVKQTILVDEPTLLSFSQHVSWGPAGDTRELKTVARKKPRWIGIDILALDAGFDSLANHRYIRCQLKARDALRTGNGHPGRMKNPAVHRFMRGFPTRFYRKRSKVETCFSVIKRKFSDHILSRKPRLRLQEAMIMGIVYNIHRALQLGLLYRSAG